MLVCDYKIIVCVVREGGEGKRGKFKKSCDDIGSLADQIPVDCEPSISLNNFSKRKNEQEQERL